MIIMNIMRKWLIKVVAFIFIFADLAAIGILARATYEPEIEIADKQPCLSAETIANTIDEGCPEINDSLEVIGEKTEASINSTNDSIDNIDIGQTIIGEFQEFDLRQHGSDHSLRPQ